MDAQALAIRTASAQSRTPLIQHKRNSNAWDRDESEDRQGPLSSDVRERLDDKERNDAGEDDAGAGGGCQCCESARRRISVKEVGYKGNLKGSVS